MEKYLGERIPKLGFGMMRLPQKDGRIDIEQTKEMVDLYLAAGFTYFDTSWGYPGSERAIKEALCDRYPRESYILASKCPVWAGKGIEVAHGMLEKSLERTGAGYFDFYLHHNLGEGRTHFFDDYGMWDLVEKARQEGLVKHVGFSIHDNASALSKILSEHPNMEFVQLQINYADWENPAVQSRACLEVAQKHGKPVIIMEPVKGGTLATPPPQVMEIFEKAAPGMSAASWGIRFAASLPGIITVLSGMSNVAQMQDNLSYMKDFKPLSEAEQQAVIDARAVLEGIDSVPCTSCGYCMKDCPQEVAIYGTFEAINIYKRFGDLKTAKGKYGWNTKGHGWGLASQCIECGACAEVCPQHIAIPEQLAAAAAVLEAETAPA
ncbi:MAG: aldo/keto reductase [Clostridiales Family XIII bacterium]|jgi:predicted aldo/keto reductase-like oxidoreductase|nr:aldo/keto reductase [Clostridiales Family XIII bacterium]